MQTNRLLHFDLTALAVAFLSLLWFQLSRGNLTYGLTPLVVLVLVKILPRLKQLADFKLACLWLFVIFIVDEPANLPFAEFNPLTEWLGALVFEAPSKLFLLPGFRFIGVELISYGLVLWVAFKNSRNDLINLQRSASFRWAVYLAVLIPGTALFATAWGTLVGNSPAVAITQIRFMPVLACWLYLGYVTCQSDADIKLFFTVLTAAMAFKALQGLFVYFVIFAGTLGEREYLLEHLTSDYMATAMFFLASVLVLHKTFKVNPWWLAALILIIFLPYIFNERRASFLGVGLSLMLSPVLLQRYLKGRHYLLAAGLLLFVAGFIAATWNTKGPIGILAQTVQSFTASEPNEEGPDYRDIENFNLYNAAFKNPATGLGFGRRFPMVVELPDISTIYENMDLIPHNTLLYMWAFAGPFGMAALGSFVALALAMMVRLFQISRRPWLLVFSFVGFTMLIRWLVFIFADIGLLELRTLALIGLVTGMAIKFLAQAKKEDNYAAAS